MQKVKDLIGGLFTSESPRGSNDNPQPDILWREIFLRTHYDDLLKLRLVCKQFYYLLDNAFWKDRCKEGGVSLPPSHITRVVHEKGQEFDYWYLYHGACRGQVDPYGPNIVSQLPIDPELARQFAEEHASWINYQAHGCTLEEPPDGYRANDICPPRCLATSYHWGWRRIVIDLVGCGVEPWILDHLRPTIVVEEQHAPRHDCGAVYQLALAMFKENEEARREYQHVTIPKVRGNKIERTYEQWAVQPWVHEVLKHEKYPAGMRKACCCSHAKDTQFWAGNYGMKFTDTVIRLEFPEEVHWYEEDEIEDETFVEEDLPSRRPFRSLRVPFRGAILPRPRGPANN